MQFIKDVWDRVANEPVLVGTLIVTAGLIGGRDWTVVAETVVSLIAILGGVLVRSKVTPVRSL